jgi:Na+-translocating ferredoxin:NAD+ oxidoreductase subunit A
MKNPGLFIQIILSSALINNVVLSYFLGLCPFFGVSRKISSAAGLGAAVTITMFLTTLVCAAVDDLLIVTFGLQYLRLLVFVLVITAVVYALELFLRRSPRQIYENIGAYLPVVTLNCATVGVALILTGENPLTAAPYTVMESAIASLSAGAGFTLVVLLMAGIRERLEFAPVPQSLQGLPIALISAGLMAMAFYGFGAFNLLGGWR